MKKWMSLYLLFLSFNTIASLPAIEKNIATNVDNNAKAEIAFLKKTVNINSGTHNLKGVKKVGIIYQKMLRELGFKTTWIKMPNSMQRADHLFAFHKNSNGTKILLLGHMDTVFEKDSPFQTFKRKGNIAKGPGVIDMKGGNAIMLYALKALKKAHVLKEANITVAFIGDEESSGHPKRLSRGPLIALGKQNDIALAFESARDLHHAVTSRRGIVHWALLVKGIQGHSSLIFTKDFGEGAILGMADMLEGLKKIVAPFQFLTFNPGLIVGGTKITHFNSHSRANTFGKMNVIAKNAYVSGGMRFLYPQNLDTVIAKTQALTASISPPLKAYIRINKNRALPSMAPSKGNEKLLQHLNTINKMLGYGKLKAISPLQKGAADIAYIAKDVAGLDGLGGIGKFDHSPNEYIKINESIRATKRLAIFLYQLNHTKNHS